MDCFVDKVECVFLHILTKLSVGLFTYAEIAYFKFPCISKFYQHARMFLHCWCKLISCYIQLYMCIYIVMCPVKKKKRRTFCDRQKKIVNRLKRIFANLKMFNFQLLNQNVFHQIWVSVLVSKLYACCVHLTLYNYFLQINTIALYNYVFTEQHNNIVQLCFTEQHNSIVQLCFYKATQ